MKEVFVGGVWRDYARQSGAVTLRLADYRQLTGDATVSDVGLWLEPGASAAAVVAAGADEILAARRGKRTTRPPARLP